MYFSLSSRTIGICIMYKRRHCITVFCISLHLGNFGTWSVFESFAWLSMSQERSTHRALCINLILFYFTRIFQLTKAILTTSRLGQIILKVVKNSSVLSVKIIIAVSWTPASRTEGGVECRLSGCPRTWCGWWSAWTRSLPASSSTSSVDYICHFGS